MTTAAGMAPFSGSYRVEDVTFLLKVVELAPTDIETKERLIQSGRRHYSEMVSAERAPEAAYMDLFWSAFARNRQRFATDVAVLARAIAQRRPAGIAIASLARAGTPVGVLLTRALRAMNRTVEHYSLSIIRDRGIDTVALDRIVASHGAEAVVFVDGWTGKGAITAELQSCIAAYNARNGVRLDPSLAVIADLAGVTDLAATREDYLIPSSILNAVVSGLISRTVLNDEHVGPGDYHACVYYADLAAHDISRQFVDEVTPIMLAALHDGPAAAAVVSPPPAALRAGCEAFVEACMKRHGVLDRNRIKPGIGEATRSLLRRVPESLIVREPEHEDVRHLMQLAAARHVPVIVDPDLAPPYRAAAVIKTLGEG